MLKVETFEAIRSISCPGLRKYLSDRAKALRAEYCLSALSEVGRFVILERSEADLFREEYMEFVERLSLGEETYLHGVRILGDCFGEEVFLPVEDVRQ